MKKRIGMAVVALAITAAPLASAVPAGADNNSTKVHINNVRLCINRCALFFGGFGFPL